MLSAFQEHLVTLQLLLTLGMMVSKGMAAGVCIVSQSVKDSGLIDLSVLEKTGNYKVKVSLKGSADLIFSRSGHIVAFDLLHVKDLIEEDSAAFTRISKLGATYKDAFAIVRMDHPSQQGRDAFQAASCRYCGNPVMVAIPTGTDLTMLILKLTATHASATAGDLLQQADLLVETQTTLKKTLMSIPHLHLSEHQASALCLLGSLRDICTSSVEDILRTTDLDVSQCGSQFIFLQEINAHRLKPPSYVLGL